MTDYFRVCTTIVFLFLLTFAGCTSEDAKYQPKPEDIPKIPAGDRMGTTGGEFLPPADG